MDIIHVTQAEHVALANLTNPIWNGKTVMQLIQGEGGVTLKVDDTKAMQESAQAQRRGIPGGFLFMPCNAWGAMLQAAINNNVTALKCMMVGLICDDDSGRVWVKKFKPDQACRFFTFSSLTKGSASDVQLHSLLPNKAVDVDIIQPNGTVDVTASGTTDADGLATINITPTAGFTGGRATLRVRQTVATVAEYPADLESDVIMVHDENMPIS